MSSRRLLACFLLGAMISQSDRRGSQDKNPLRRAPHRSSVTELAGKSKRTSLDRCTFSNRERRQVVQGSMRQMALRRRAFSGLRERGGW
jgi:hypothetical protein